MLYHGAMEHPAIRCALIGFGVSARVFHLPFLRADPAFEIVGVLERSGDLSRAVLPGAALRRDLDGLLGLAPELALVCSPNALHYEHAKRCLQAGCHVLVEKPFAASPAQAEELIDLARASKRVLAVYHNRRLDGDFQTLRELVAGACLGRLAEAEFRWERWSPALRAKRWKEDGSPASGLLEDLGSHLVDQALCLWGMPRRLRARLGIQREGSRVDDAFDLDFEYPPADGVDGLHLRLKGGLLARQETPRYSLFGSGGSFVKFGVDPQEAQLGAGMAPGGAGYGVEPAAQWGLLRHRLGGGGPWLESRVETRAGDYGRFHANLARAIRDGEELLVPPGQALDVLRVIAAARASAPTGAWVAP